jgi:hypothetical protein
LNELQLVSADVLKEHFLKLSQDFLAITSGDIEEYIHRPDFIVIMNGLDSVILELHRRHFNTQQ